MFVFFSFFCMCLSCKPSKLQPLVRRWRIWPQGQPCPRPYIRCECVFTFIHWQIILSSATRIAFIVFISLQITSMLLVPCTTSWSAVFLWLVHSYLTVFYILHSPLFFVFLLALLNQISFFPGQHYRFIPQLVSVWIFYDLHWVLGSPPSQITWNTFFFFE